MKAPWRKGRGKKSSAPTSVTSLVVRDAIAPDDRPTQGGTKKPFVINFEERVPSELRMMIFDNVFRDTWHGRRSKNPALLKAVRGNRTLYAEALESFARCNTFILTDLNLTALLKLSPSAMTSLRSLRIGSDFKLLIVQLDYQQYYASHPPAIEAVSWNFSRYRFQSDLTPRYCRTPLGKIFREATALRELHLDIRLFHWVEGTARVKHIIRICLAHLPTLRRLIFTQLKDGTCGWNSESEMHASRLHSLDRHLGSVARLWIVAARCCFDQWFWEAETGRALVWRDFAPGESWDQVSM